MNLTELYASRGDLPDEKKYLETYKMDNYFRPSVSSDVVAFTIGNTDEENYRKEGEARLLLLLVRRGTHPFMNSWALPGGFLRSDESVEECAFREIVEETGIKPVSMKHVGVFSDCDRDPRGRIISNAFTSIIVDGSTEAHGGQDANDAKWFEITFTEQSGLYYLNLVNEDIVLKAVLKEIRNEFGIRRFEIIESGDIAFDHAAIIGTALTSLRNDVMDFNLLFDFVPKKFTLLKLQRIQETITGRTTQAANFRRKIADYVEETDEYETGAGHRPAKLYIAAGNGRKG